MMAHRKFLLGWAIALACTAPAAARPILVELFTSEGCSSCPPADAFLAELAKRGEVLALSLHVDYWDGLGWKDRFASPALTARQRGYMRLLDLATVYTPQMVIDGRWQAVGSERAAVNEALALAVRERTPEVPLTLTVSTGRARLQIAAAAASSAAPASVILIGFDRGGTDAVRGGENDGRTLAYVNVVRGIEQIGEFRGSAAELTAPLPWRADRVAAIVQAADGKILGLAVADAPSS